MMSRFSDDREGNQSSRLKSEDYTCRQCLDRLFLTLNKSRDRSPRRPLRPCQVRLLEAVISGRPHGKYAVLEKTDATPSTAPSPLVCSHRLSRGLPEQAASSMAEACQQ